MAFSIEVRGLVQGVGFRPFIYNLALSLDRKGYVCNSDFGVIIVLDAEKKDVESFVGQIKLHAPSLSEIESIEVRQIKQSQGFNDFVIKKSRASKQLLSKIPPDIAMCEACKKELEDKNSRRYQYPFISCTNCGPRFSIIYKLPYDRDKTSMHIFTMCKKCEVEYEDPSDRRYHAQTIGCFECGPRLSLFKSKDRVLEIKSEAYIDEVVKQIGEGKIVAVKGVGGYHLICDARNDKSVEKLRQRKNRPTKPFAIMVKDIKMAKKIAKTSIKEEELLSSFKRPIVLLEKNSLEYLSKSVSPNITQLGLFLAYTPVHDMILQKLDFPLIMTSANISNEPICSSFDEIMKLSSVWDYCLDHDRDIVNSCDDSVVFVEEETMFMLREARGYSPRYFKTSQKMQKKVLCLGAHQKSAVAICSEDRVILSPYIGDLDGLQSIEHFKSHINRLKTIYNFEPDVIVCDKHPDYESSKHAKALKENNPGLELIQVQHHYAHILATMGVNDIRSKVLGISFDGTGYGDDGKLWGGEFLVCDRSGYERVGHFKYFKLLGGEKAIKEPRRVALSFLFELYGEKVFELNSPTLNAFSKTEINMLYTVWEKGLNSPLSSSCGRLFDAVASLLDLTQVCSYEGESGLLLESLYDERIKDKYQFSIDETEIDFSAIVAQILDETNKEKAVSKFFNTIVEVIYQMGEKYQLPIVLGGGVFQNRVLLRLIKRKIPKVILPKSFVSNDGGISYGQAIFAEETSSKI